MAVFKVDPLTDPRWSTLLEARPESSIFHSQGWLEALQRTYGFEPVCYTTSAPESELRNALVFCQVNSWLTGRKLISLPFSDHCQPLIDDPFAFEEILSFLEMERLRANQRSVEIRPRDMTYPVLIDNQHFAIHEVFHYHTLDLRRSPEEIFKSFHKNSIQQKVRRAEREGLTYMSGRTPFLLRSFYKLLVMSRRQHGLPPQPINWFLNILNCARDSATIRLALKDDEPVAAMLTLKFKDTVVYKYGCSSKAGNQFGGTPFLLWKTVQEATAEGCATLDLGRSDLDNSGLVTFKDRLGTERSTLVYYWNIEKPASRSGGLSSNAFIKKLMPFVPSLLLIQAGRLLYRHAA